MSDLGWQGQYFVDADHIGLGNIDLFLDSSDFFTLDVVNFIGKKADSSSLQQFVQKYSLFIGDITIPGLDGSLTIDKNLLQNIAEKYLLAVQEAGKIYRYIANSKGEGNFITEVSMDETTDPRVNQKT